MEYKQDLRPGRAILGAFSIALLMKLFLFDFMIVEGHSMLPTIKPGSVLIVDKLAYGLRPPWSNLYLFCWALPQQGDVVIFYTPSGEVAVKRCVEIIQEQEFMALGDNSLDSYDSRAYGSIPVRNIIGKALGI